MRSLYAISLISYYARLVIVRQMLNLLYSNVIVSHCISYFYGIVIGNLRSTEIVLYSIMYMENFYIFLRRAVLVRCMPDIIFACLNLCYKKAYTLYGFMQRLESSTNSIICTLYNSWLIRFEILNHWLKSLYTA